MIILLKHILRNIRENKFRSLLIVLSLAVTSMVLYVNIGAGESLAKGYGDMLKDYNKCYDTAVVPDTDSGITRFKESDVSLDCIPVKQLQPLTYTTTKYLDSISGDYINIVLTGCDTTQMLENSCITILTAVRDFDAESDGQLMISEWTSKKYGLCAGDSIELLTESSVKYFTIGAVCENVGRFRNEGTQISAYATLNTAENICGSGYNKYIADIADGMDFDSLRTRFESENPGFTLTDLSDTSTVGVDEIQKIMIIILVCAIVLNFFVISSFTKLILATRIPVIGTFRSIGADRKKVNFILLLENALYGVIGGTAGIAAALLSNKYFISAMSGGEVDNASAEISVKNIVTALLFSVVLQLAIVFVSVVRAGRQNIIRTIFNTLSTAATVSLKKFIIGIIMVAASAVIFFLNTSFDALMNIAETALAMAGVILALPMLSKLAAKLVALICGLFRKGGALKLGAMNVYGSKTTLSSILLVTVSMSLILTIYNVSLQTKATFASALKSGWGDILIEGGITQPVEHYSYIKDVEGVKNMEYLYGNFDVCRINNGDKEYFAVLGADKAKIGLKDPYCVLGTLNEGEIVVDEVYATKHDIALGSFMRIEMETDNYIARYFKVVNYVDSSCYTTMRTVAIINEKDYTALYGSIPQVMSIECDNPAEVDEVVKRVSEAASTDGLSAVSVTDWLGGQMDQINSLMNLIYAILFMSGLLAAVGLLNNQIVGFLQKQKEYAVLYSVAMSKKQIRLMIAAEICISFFIGCIIGGALGLWEGQIVNSLMVSLGFCLVNVSAAPAVMGISLASFVLLSFTALVPMYRAGKIDVVKQIKYE